MFERSKEFPLFLNEDSEYSGLACDGCQTYLISSGKQILIFNEDSSSMNRLHTYCCYHTLCYDIAGHCFWAASPDFPGTVFCLSDKLTETGHIQLYEKENQLGAIDHLYYDGLEKRLYLAAGNTIYSMDSYGNTEKILELKDIPEKLEGICAYANYLIGLSGRQLNLISSYDGTVLERQQLPEDITVISMALVLDPSNLLSLGLRLFVVKKDSAYAFLDYGADAGFFTQYSIPFRTKNAAPEQPEAAPDIQMQQLWGNRLFGNRRGPNSHGYSHRCNGPYARTDGFSSPYHSFNANQNCSGNDQNTADSHYNPDLSCPVCGRPACCPSWGCPSCCFNDIIESIALTETSLAHVLNAEGEKLQKAIASSSDVSELLKVNESVIKTIIHCTHLEQVLYYKLEAVLNAESCPCCPNPCTCGETEPSSEIQSSACHMDAPAANGEEVL